jgi:hypothetical protein
MQCQAVRSLAVTVVFPTRIARPLLTSSAARDRGILHTNRADRLLRCAIDNPAKKNESSQIFNNGTFISSSSVRHAYLGGISKQRKFRGPIIAGRRYTTPKTSA